MNIQTGILKETHTNMKSLSHVCRFNLSDEFFNTMKEKGLEACLNVIYEDSEVYDNDMILTFIWVPTYKSHTIDPLLFFVKTVVPISII